MTDRHLWEYDHPYYCNEGNYLASPVNDRGLDVWERHESWASFFEAWGDSDPDMNLVFRWDWHAWHLESPEDFPDEDGLTEKHELQLFFMLQRKAFNKSVTVRVTEGDEPAVREWLTTRAGTVAAIWEPLLPGNLTAPFGSAARAARRTSAPHVSSRSARPSIGVESGRGTGG